MNVRGKINFNLTTDATNGKIYEPKEIVYSCIGTIGDGNFV